MRRFRGQLREPDAAHLLDLLAALVRVAHPESLKRNPPRMLDLMAESSEVAFVPALFGYSNYGRPGFRSNLIRFGPVPLGSADHAQGGILGGAGIAVSRHSRHPQAAATYAAFVVEADVQCGVYFTSGGAESNESAFKTVRFFWRSQGKPDKIKIISRQWAYHGVSIAAMSATGLPAYHKMFAPMAPGHVHIPAPYYYRADTTANWEEYGVEAANELEKAILREGPETVAAFIAEPVQGAGGVIPPPPTYFPRIREICDQYDVLFIADEVLCGYGRTGQDFAIKGYGVEPDILTAGKAISSGYAPLSATIVSEKVVDAFAKSASGDFTHGSTHSGNALSCFVGLQVHNYMRAHGLFQRPAQIGAYLHERLAEASGASRTEQP